MIEYGILLESIRACIEEMNLADVEGIITSNLLYFFTRIPLELNFFLNFRIREEGNSVVRNDDSSPWINAGWADGLWENEGKRS